MYFLQTEKSNTRFLVAKYIPDMRRLEPRNIGVIVWTDGHLSAHFLGEGGEIARAPRRLGVQNQDTYRQWIRYWRSEMSRPTLSINGNDQRIARESPEFIDALRQRSKENFVLVDGGFVTGHVNPGDIDEVVQDLFVGLVEEGDDSGDSHAEDAILLKKAVSHIFHASGIDGVQGYQAKTPLTFSVESHVFAFTFDWTVYTDSPQAVFQHAMLTRPMSVNSAAFMFSCLARADFQPYRVRKERCLALVRTTAAIMDNEAAVRELEKLKAYSTVVDVSDEERSINELRHLSLSL